MYIKSKQKSRKLHYLFLNCASCLVWNANDIPFLFSPHLFHGTKTGNKKDLEV